jgi:hypothetical protein
MATRLAQTTEGRMSAWLRIPTVSLALHSS